MLMQLKTPFFLFAMIAVARFALSAEPAADNPKVSKPFASLLRAAQEANSSKHYDEALADIQQVQAAALEKTSEQPVGHWNSSALVALRSGP
ncbi:MAG TPA: hypothetical protein VHZ99_00765 [Steroidobacteraceae bacterium]|jgi:hypothetical protein|nr:hypothetical protein [Steroidobacteraceae bacterium]